VWKSSFLYAILAEERSRASSNQVMRGGQRVEFSGKEFELLEHFLCHSGETLSRERLLDEVWGYENFPTTRTVDAHMFAFARNSNPFPKSLVTF
jgi:DNA-binding response OmpR family regulator